MPKCVCKGGKDEGSYCKDWDKRGFEWCYFDGKGKKFNQRTKIEKQQVSSRQQKLKFSYSFACEHLFEQHSPKQMNLLHTCHAGAFTTHCVPSCVHMFGKGNEFLLSEQAVCLI